MNLNILTREFLEASGYDTYTQGADYINGKRQTVAGVEQEIEIWVPNISDSLSFKSQENPYLRKFRAAKKNRC